MPDLPEKTLESDVHPVSNGVEACQGAQTFQRPLPANLGGSSGSGKSILVDKNVGFTLLAASLCRIHLYLRLPHVAKHSRDSAAPQTLFCFWVPIRRRSAYTWRARSVDKRGGASNPRTVRLLSTRDESMDTHSSWLHPSIDVGRNHGLFNSSPTALSAND